MVSHLFIVWCSFWFTAFSSAAKSQGEKVLNLDELITINTFVFITFKKKKYSFSYSCRRRFPLNLVLLGIFVSIVFFRLWVSCQCFGKFGRSESWQGFKWTICKIHQDSSRIWKNKSHSRTKEITLFLWFRLQVQLLSTGSLLPIFLLYLDTMILKLVLSSDSIC